MFTPEFRIEKNKRGFWVCDYTGDGIGPMSKREASKFAAAIEEGVPIRGALRLLRCRVSLCRPAV